MKIRRTALCLALGMLFVQAFALPARAMEVEAEAAILADALSGTVIYEKNADALYDVSGMSKLMTILLAAEAIEAGQIALSDTVTVSKTAASVGGMSAFLTYGEQYTVEELLKAAAMISANDAAMALAEHIGGSAAAFTERMNERAKALGLSGTFVSPTGHKAEGQSLSARDCAALAAELSAHPEVLEYSSIYMDKLIHAGGRETDLVNPNRLVRFYSGCDGLATGSGGSGGYCGTFTAQRGGSRYIAVIIGAKNAEERADAAQQLLDIAFTQYESVLIVEKGKGLARDVPVENGRKKTVHGVAGEELQLLLGKGAASRVKKTVELQEGIAAPLAEGQQIGEMLVTLDGKELARIPVVAYETIDEATVFGCAREVWLDWLRR